MPTADTAIPTFHLTAMPDSLLISSAVAAFATATSTSRRRPSMASRRDEISVLISWMD